MTYPTLETVNATTDLSNIFIYVNEITNGYAMPSVLGAFFLIIMLGSIFAQLRFKGTVRPDFAFAVAGFASFGLAVLMSLKNGLLNPAYLMISLALAILGALWVYLSGE